MIPVQTIQVARTSPGQSNTNTVDVRPLEVTLFDDFVEPLAGIRYHFSGDGVDVEGKTEGDGTARAIVPRHLKSITLEFWPAPDEPDNSAIWELEIGELDAVESSTGLEARLDALGFHSGDTTEAIRAFQDFAGLQVTGSADAATQKALNQLYGEGF